MTRRLLCLTSNGSLKCRHCQLTNESPAFAHPQLGGQHRQCAPRLIHRLASRVYGSNGEAHVPEVGPGSAG